MAPQWAIETTEGKQLLLKEGLEADNSRNTRNRDETGLL